MGLLTFREDVRHNDPDETGARRARFLEGWRKAVVGHEYTQETLARLTWDNLGFRLGKLFGPTSPLLMDQMYEWCVHQQAKRGFEPVVPDK